MGSSTEARGCLLHMRRAAAPLPVAWPAQSGRSAWAPGRAQPASPHEHRSPPSTASSQVPGNTSQ